MKTQATTTATAHDLLVAAGEPLSRATTLVQQVIENPSDRSLKDAFTAEVERNEVLVEQAIQAKEGELRALIAQLKRDGPRAAEECAKHSRVVAEARASFTRAEAELGGAVQWEASIVERLNRATNDLRNARAEINAAKNAGRGAGKLDLAARLERR